MPGIYRFTPAFDEKAPAFGDTRNRVLVKMNSYFYLLISYLFLNLPIPLLGQNIKKTFSMRKSVFINPFVDRGFKILFGR